MGPGPRSACDCGADIQSMRHIVNDCPIRAIPGGLASLNRIDKAALDWIRAVNLALWWQFQCFLQLYLFILIVWLRHCSAVVCVFSYGCVADTIRFIYNNLIWENKNYSIFLINETYIFKEKQAVLWGFVINKS